MTSNTAMRILLASIIFLSLHVAAVQAAQAETRKYAIVIAHSQDLAGKAPALEFADDDGARYYEYFTQIADHVALYTVLDSDSQPLFREAARAARPPKRDDILHGVADIFEQAQRDREHGHDVVFYFVLIGHGDLGAGGEGYVSLLDAQFTRTDLFQHVLARSPATINHVVIDACNSYFLVHRRGGAEDDTNDERGPGHGDVVRAYLSRESIDRYPNTGFVLSTSSEKESHEWARYRGGVFSHQLRSALVGLADVNRDGAVEYSEVQAFVAAANAGIQDSRARVELFAQPPAIDQARPLVELGTSRFDRWLRIPAGEPLHAYVEDARGVRYADFHTTGQSDILLALAPSEHYFVRTYDERLETKVALRARGRVDLMRSALARSSMQARGAVSESFRVGLYREPFGPAFYRGYVAQANSLSVSFDRPRFTPAAAPDARASELAAAIALLNERARGDEALKKRLSAVRGPVLEALARREYDRAHALLEPLLGSP